MIRDKSQQYKAVVGKELQAVKKREEKLSQVASKPDNVKWKQSLIDKVPEKVYENLQKGFCKAFAIVFEKGTGIIEKGYSREAIQDGHKIREFAFQVRADRKSLKSMHRDAVAANRINMAITTAEGIGLGALGIGMPDIVIFVGVLLKGVYEVALRYGFDYGSDKERYFILKLMETAISKEDMWIAGNEEINRLIGEAGVQEDWAEAVKGQIPRTADAFAVDMLLLKFVQGLPVVGIIGGAGNPFYYNKVMKYVEIKYRERYLLKWQEKETEELGAAERAEQ